MKVWMLCCFILNMVSDGKDESDLISCEYKTHFLGLTLYPGPCTKWWRRNAGGFCSKVESYPWSAYHLTKPAQFCAKTYESTLTSSFWMWSHDTVVKFNICQTSLVVARWWATSPSPNLQDNKAFERCSVKTIAEVYVRHKVNFALGKFAPV